MALVLVAVLVASWIHLATGAGTGMYPHEMAVLVPGHASAGTSLPVTDGVAGHETVAGGHHVAMAPSRSMAPATWTAGHALLMFSMWWLMMIAMMVPSAAPVLLLHAAITRQGLSRAGATRPAAPSRRAHPATTAFAGGYLLMWAAFSLVAVAAQRMLEGAGLLGATMTSTSALLGSGLLLAAGLWQLTPLKSACLRHCRSPIGFLTMYWRPGVAGALRMGVVHGVFCLGCCWFLMALLFYAGVMNLIWIVGLALLVLMEKVLPAGVATGRVAGVLLIAWGGWSGITALSP